MTQNSIEQRRSDLIEQLTKTREKYNQCIADVPAHVANTGSEWSIADLLRHTTGGSYRTMLSRLLSEDNPKMSAFDPDGNWKRLVDSSLQDIDEVISKAKDLTAEDLGRSGWRADQTISVLDVLILMANHYDEHLRQLNEEVRPREGLSRV